VHWVLKRSSCPTNSPLLTTSGSYWDSSEPNTCDTQLVSSPAHWHKWRSAVLCCNDDWNGDRRINHKALLSTVKGTYMWLTWWIMQFKFLILKENTCSNLGRWELGLAVSHPRQLYALTKMTTCTLAAVPAVYRYSIRREILYSHLVNMVAKLESSTRSEHCTLTLKAFSMLVNGPPTEYRSSGNTLYIIVISPRDCILSWHQCASSVFESKRNLHIWHCRSGGIYKLHKCT